MVAKAEVKRELGFTGLGSYHGGNEGRASSEEFHDNVERQGKIPEFTGGLSNYGAAVGGGFSRNAEFNEYNGNYHQHGGNLHNNPVVTPNFHAQTNVGHHSPAFDNAWSGGNKFGIFQNGLNVGHPAPLDVSAPKPIIPVQEDVRHSGPLLSPLRHVAFTGITLPPATKDYKNGAFISSAHPGFSVPHDNAFGLRLLPSRVGHGLFDHGPIRGNFDSGATHLLGSFHGHQANFGRSKGYFPVVQGNNVFSQHSFGHDTSGFKAGVQGQGVNHLASSHTQGITHGSGQVGHSPPVQGHSDGESSLNYGNSFDNTAHTSAENHGSSSYGGDHVTNDVNSQHGSHFESERQGNTDNQQSLDYNSSQQDYPPVNEHDVGHHSTTSHEVQNDSIGSHDYGDTSQINHSGSAEQKYIPGADQATSHVQDSGQNSQDTPTQRDPTSHGSTSSSLITNGHAVGHADSGSKATSFQSFIIHSYRPKRVFARKFVPKPFIPVHSPFINIPPPPVHHSQ